MTCRNDRPVPREMEVLTFAAPHEDAVLFFFIVSIVSDGRSGD
jgi:hypothetical protein